MMGNIQAIEVQIPHEVCPILGMVPGIWNWIVGAGYCRGGQVGVGHRRHDVVLRMALGVGLRHRDRAGGLGGHWAGFFHHLLAAILFGVVGLMLVTRPVISAEALTFFMALFFLISGLFQLIASIAVAQPGWGWQAADEIITLILGALVLTQWPVSGLWVIGLFVGIDLIFYGFSWIALALSLRTM